jgi:VCBS repeat-containing protein
MIETAAALMLDAIGSEAADAAYAETFVAPDWNIPPISGASANANALVASSYAVLQDCAEMLAAAQRYQGAVLAGDASAQAAQDLAFNTAFAQYNQDRVTVSAAIDAFPTGVADVSFEADTTLAGVQAYLAGLTDPTTQDPVLSAWISAITEAFPGLAAPLPTDVLVIIDDAKHALELIAGTSPGGDSGSVKAAIDGIANTLSIPNHNPVMGVTESGSSLPLVEAGIDVSGNPATGTTTHSFAVSVSDQDGDTTLFAKSGWTLVSGTTYSKVGVYGTATFNIVTGQVVYTLNNNDPDTQALFAGQSVTDHFVVTVFDGKGGFDTEDLQIGIVGTNDRPVNVVPSVALGVIKETDFHFGTQPFNSIQVSDDSATLTVILGVTHGTLALESVAGLSFGDSDGSDGTLTFSGSRTNINAVLAGLIFSPGATYEGSAQLTIQTTDTEGFSDSDIVNLNIHAINGLPVGNDDTASVNQYGTISGNVILGDAGHGVADTDTDLGDILSVVQVQGANAGQALAGAFGLLTLSASGGYTYVANDVQPIAAGTVVQDVFTYLLTDGLDFDLANLTISVTGMSTGTAGDNHLLANDLGSTLSGLAGNDSLDGSDGIDILIGGAGLDTLTGGLGADRFKFNVKTESKKGALHDVILDFSGAGGEHDQIDLSAMDAKKGHGNQAFKFIGTKKFHHKMGELHIVKHGTYVTVEGDVDGNGKADFQIDAHNLTDTLSILTKADFIL